MLTHGAVSKFFLLLGLFVFIHSAARFLQSRQTNGAFFWGQAVEKWDKERCFRGPEVLPYRVNTWEISCTQMESSHKHVILFSRARVCLYTCRSFMSFESLSGSDSVSEFRIKFWERFSRKADLGKSVKWFNASGLNSFEDTDFYFQLIFKFFIYKLYLYRQDILRTSFLFAIIAWQKEDLLKKRKRVVTKTRNKIAWNQKNPG